MKDALFHLDPIEGVGLQAQVREMLVSAILSRRLQPGEVVPSSRRMAEQLSVSRNTVTLAYQALVADGYLEGRDRSGYYVGMDAPVVDTMTATRGNAPINAENTRTWQQRFRRSSAGLDRIAKPLNWREYAYPFVYGQADPTLFNHSDWRDCARQALGLRNFEAMAGDKGEADDPLLVDYIRARTLPRRGVMVTPEQILVTMGAQNALFLLAELFCARGVRVAIPGLRLGYVAAPEPVIAEARALRFLMLRHPPGYAQRTAAYFLALGHHDALIKRLRNALAERRKVMEQALDIAGLSDAKAPQFGGASFWTEVPDEVDTADLALRLQGRGVLIEPGAPFFAEKKASRHMRLGYSSIKSEKIEAGIKIISEEIERLR